MKFLKTHYGRAINVIPNDTVNIPNPAGLGTTGTTTGAGNLTDSTVTFTTNLLGAIVVNTTDNTIANVIGFIDIHTLELDNSIFLLEGGENYAIYNSDNNQGCSIYIPQQEPNQLTVLTVGGDIITFNGCGDTNASSILPVNVLRVFDTDTYLQSLIALW